MKKYMIRCDIEGVTGVVSYDQAEPGKAEYEFGRKMFMSDLTALIEGLIAGGADEIYIYDEHCDGRNIDLGEIKHENVTVICGKPPYRKDWAGGLDESFSGMLMLGFHSKRGTENALLNHSYEPDIADIRLDGVSVGEIGNEAAIAGDYNVPLLLVTADSEGVREAKELIPGVIGVTVKESQSEFGAECYPSILTAKWIYDAAKEAAGNPPEVKPLKMRNIKAEIELREGAFKKMYERLYPDTIQNGVTTIRGETATEVWAVYWERKQKCYAEIGREV